MTRLGKLWVVLLAAVFFLGAVQAAEAQKKKKKKASPYISGVIDTVGKRTILLKVMGKRRPIVIPIDRAVTKIKKASDEIKMGDLKKGDVIFIKKARGDYDPVLYVIQSGEKAKLKKKKKKK